MGIFITISIIFFCLYAVVVLLPAILFVFPDKKRGVNSHGVSVVIAARNEEKHIGDCVDSVCAQGEFVRDLEVIVVNDHSEDRTNEIIRERMQVHSNLKIVDLADSLRGKKAGLTTGIALAENPIILVTDADCKVSADWVNTMRDVFSDEKILFATGPLLYDRDTLVQSELIALQVINCGYGRMGMLPLASGANMAFRKKFFEEVKGFSGDRFASGDDIFLLGKAKARGPNTVAFVRDRGALVLTNPANGMQAIIAQRARWLGKTGGMGSLWMKICGSLIALANLVFVVLFCLSIYEKGENPAGIILLLTKPVVDLLLLSLAFPFFRNTPVFFTMVLSELVYPFILLFSLLMAMTGKVKWKGRNIRGTDINS